MNPAFRISLLLAAAALAILARPPNPIAQEMLDAHNAVRARVGVPPLTWSTQLESVAKQWAESLLATGEFNHRPNSNYGENLFEIRGSQASSPAQVIASWSSEAKDYDSAKNSCRPGAVCGHYTQIVWRKTARLGCAAARGRGREVWVCNYDPPGNWTGQRPY